MHPLFPNLTARERLLDSHEQPLHLLAPHIYSSHVEFEAITTFILTVMATSDKLLPVTKDYSVITTKKLALNYVQSHRLYLAQKSDKLKIRHYLLAKEAINRSQSQISIQMPSTKVDASKDFLMSKHLRDQRGNNEYIRQSRALHSQAYFRRLTKFNSRQMRSLLLKETPADVKRSIDPSDALIKESDIAKLIQRLLEKPAHRFVVMRFKKWRQPVERDCCLELSESLVSQTTNLSVIDWLSKKNI